MAMEDETKLTTVETDVGATADGGTKTTTTTTTTTTRRTLVETDAAAATEPASSSPSSVISTSLVGKYDEWVTGHTGLARNVETMLYVAPQLVPKRVMEPEVATQFGYSLVGLLHLYHDYVLFKSSSSDAEPPTNSEQLTRLIRVPLSLISHVQVLAEVVARKVGGDVGKWRLIVWVEVVKGVLRLMLLSQQRRAMLARGGKDATFDVGEVAREDLLLGGEVCHILRPVVYALLRHRRPETSWTPVAVSLLVEVSGLAMSAAAVKSETLKKPASGDKAKEELAARKMALLLYFLRDPVFATVTKPATGKVQDRILMQRPLAIEHYRSPWIIFAHLFALCILCCAVQAADVLDYVPGVGKLFRFGVTAILDYYHQFHFYTSAS
ncbi:hypothetical protein BBJ28_00005937 [Nothophytophthora sp. Chile5]|nr:hypothetical protein BBJ28_00005937 [Nothophytophthora sp. Chile5]